MVRETEDVAGGGDAPFHGQLTLREWHFSYAKKRQVLLLVRLETSCMKELFFFKKKKKKSISLERQVFWNTSEVSYLKAINKKACLILQAILQLISSLLLAVYEKYTVLLKALFIWSRKKRPSSRFIFF